MRIMESSAEFELNSNFTHTMFGLPKSFESGRFVGGQEAWNKAREISVPLALEDVGKLSAWDEYKEAISGLHNPNSTYIWKDVNSSYWVSIGGTGWGCWWSVGLGSLESGKYPI